MTSHSWYRPEETLGNPFSQDTGITVLIFNHEYGQRLTAAVHSVLRQETKVPVHIVIIDDASKDQSAALIDEWHQRYPDRISAVLLRDNLFASGGPVFAYAISSCNTPYVALLDADDYWIDPSKLEKQLTFLERHENIALVHHPFLGIHEGKSRFDVMKAHPLFSSIWNAQLLSLGDGIGVSTVLLRRAFAIDPELVQDLVSWDWAYWSLVAQKGQLGNLPDVASVYVVHDKNLWAGGDPLTENLRLAAVELRMIEQSEPSMRPYWTAALRFRRLERQLLYRQWNRSARTLRRGRSLILQLCWKVRSLLCTRSRPC